MTAAPTLVLLSDGQTLPIADYEAQKAMFDHLRVRLIGPVEVASVPAPKPINAADERTFAAMGAWFPSAAVTPVVLWAVRGESRDGSVLEFVTGLLATCSTLLAAIMALAGWAALWAAIGELNVCAAERKRDEAEDRA